MLNIIVLFLYYRILLLCIEYTFMRIFINYNL